jgi:hypothetical protein
MGKRAYIVLAVLAVALVGVTMWRVWQQREPVYKGRTLTSWLMRYWSTNNTEVWIGPGDLEVKQAVRQMGTNAIPTLLRLLQAKDSALKRRTMALLKREHIIAKDYIPAAFWHQTGMYGFYVLRTNAQSALPRLIEIADQNISPSSQRAAIRALIYTRPTGPPAQQAVAHLLQWATNKDLSVQDEAIITLGNIGPPAEAAVPYLKQCAVSHDSGVRLQAKLALLRIDPKAFADSVFDGHQGDPTDLLGWSLEVQRAAPYLLQYATNAPNASVVRFLMQGLNPEAAAKAGITNAP